MIQQALYHMPETEYGYAKDEKTVCLRLRTARTDTPAVAVIYGANTIFGKSGAGRIWF